MVSNPGYTENFEPVSNYGTTEDDELFRSDALRLLSFVNWTDLSVSREALVSAGFYHAGQGRLRCAWCGGELERMSRLGSLGNPLEIHRRYFPGCLHAAMLATREAELLMSMHSPSYTPPVWTEPTIAASPENGTPNQENGTHNAENGDTSPQHQSDGATHNARVLSGGGTWRSLNVFGGAGGSKNPSKSSLAARLATFEGWPSDRPQTPQALADAGFFYTGSEDQVRCFYCDGGLGRWEGGDDPWREHARWFPHCGYLLLLKGKPFVAACRLPQEHNAAVTSSDPTPARQVTSDVRINFPFTETQVQDAMESSVAAAALGAGLDAARVRRAICRRLRNTGQPFTSAESLIDAVLDDQLNEEPWSVSPQGQRLARDILAETLRELAPQARLTSPTQWETGSDSRQSEPFARSPSPPPTLDAPRQKPSLEQPVSPAKSHVEDSSDDEPSGASSEKKELTLEEENRQLKEARLCKVCMDDEVSVVFLPCGHLVSCGACACGLPACPLCRASVCALVRAYLA